ncbi:hypothetical protein PFISCL1PPCAC_19925 [Pristionchus fissidentatus]|uniref:Uncharacterized protein n=1 Tax=Pristionchus fissidentatus TaxID=1538716 RepID=A0AAV5WD50_9BILA|nr:hypothetical protein PFISCL1PPCAC_19925 [Pristionchus fissidentatus]
MDVKKDECVIGAEDIVHILRDSLVSAPGGRDREGRPLLILTPRDTPANPDHLRNAFMYMQRVAVDSDRGFTVVVDMRGSAKWEAAKAMLKALNQVTERTKSVIHLVLIIQPQSFWEKQKAHFSNSCIKAEVQYITCDKLSRFFDVTELPRELGGTFSFDYDEWLELRLELENWIWKVAEWMKVLDECKNIMRSSSAPTCVKSAQDSITMHTEIQKRILSVPLDELDRASAVIHSRIKNGEQKGGDLDSALPHINTTIASLVRLKEEVYDMWKDRREELNDIHQCTLLDKDTEGLLSWLMSRGDLIMRDINEIGDNVEEIERKLMDLNELEESLKSAEINLNGVESSAARIRRTNRNVGKISEEFHRLEDLIAKRRHLLTCCIVFHRAESEYYANWKEWRGVRAEEVRDDSIDIDDSIQRNEEMWKSADSAFLIAMEGGGKLGQAWKAIDCGFGEKNAKERQTRLSIHHRQLEDSYKRAKKRLHMVTAFDAFQQDMKKVFDWLEEHGEPYLNKNSGIGDDKAQATHLRHNHLQFRDIARSTHVNAKKLYEVGEDCCNSGLFNNDAIRVLLNQLTERMNGFDNRIEQRLTMLNQATLFYTHHDELLVWYEEMEKKYSNLLIHTSIVECEHDNKQWSLESDGTSQAYATTVAEGTLLVKTIDDMSAMESNGGIERNVVTKLYQMLAVINERNSDLMQLWQRQRPALQFAVRLANVLSEMQDLQDQMISWEQDMHSLVRSDGFVSNASQVSPFHADNEKKVRVAVDNLSSSVNEIVQLMNAHHLNDLRTVENEKVSDLIRWRVKDIENAQVAVMRSATETSRKLEGAKRANMFKEYCKEWLDICANGEMRLLQLCQSLPTNINDALRMTSELAESRRDFEERVSQRAPIYRTRLNEILAMNVVDRNRVLEWNMEVSRSLDRLNLYFNDRRKALKVGTDFYKTYSNVVPILDHLEKEYKLKGESDWCSRVESSRPAHERSSAMAVAVSEHLAVREKFQKGCQYAQKTSDLFLRYIDRCPSNSQQRECSQHVHRLRAKVMHQQSKILELWATKKRELVRCHQYLLLDASREQITRSLVQEVERLMGRLRGKEGEERNEILIEMELCMKEHRGNIQSVISTGETMMGESEMHKGDIENTLRLIREVYNGIVMRVNELEVGKKNELSLDMRLRPSIDVKKGVSEPMRELLHTEAIYIGDLERCIKVYVEGFDRMEKEGKLPALLKGKRAEIFGNMEEIYAFHSDIFYVELLKYEHEPELVGCSFTVFVGSLSELYTSYCAHKDLNKNLLHQQETIEFFDSMREAHKMETNNSLDSLLIKPVQRVTRYGLLMKELCKEATGEGITEALEAVHNIPKKANDIIHLNYVDSKDKEQLLSAGSLVTQDTLTVWESKSLIKGKGKERQVFLFELALAVMKKVTEGGHMKTRYFLKSKPIYLSEVNVVEHVEGDSCKFALRMGEIGTNDNRMELRAKSESEKIAWIRKLREQIHGQDLVSLRLGWDSFTPREEAASERSDETKRSSLQSISSTETDGIEGAEEREEGESMKEERRDSKWNRNTNPDRPSINSPHSSSTASAKRKSIRRIFSHSSRPSPSSLSREVVRENQCGRGVVLSGVKEMDWTGEREGKGLEEGLPPPMEEMRKGEEEGDEIKEGEEKEEKEEKEEEYEEDVKKEEKTPQEMARFKRRYVLMELVETEKDYIKDLGSVVDGYMAEMQEKDLPEDLQGKDKIIFANIAQIHEFHKTSFVKEIERCLDDYNASASAFVKYERRLHTLYVKYCQNKPKSDYLVSMDAFEQYFADTKARLGHKVALCDLLIKPVQRIMKYQLLLKDILKFTLRAQDSTEMLDKALAVMHVVPKACDDMMQVGRLQNFDGNLNAQGKLMHQGTVSLSEPGVAGTAKMKERRIFLFEQSAIIADCIMPKKEFGNPNYIFKNQIMVNKMNVESEVKDVPFAFSIGSSDGPTFIAQCNSEEEKEEWISKVSAQLDQQKTLLAALVDPKRYQSQLAGGVATVSLDENDKKKGGASLFSRFKSAPSGSCPSSVSSGPTSTVPPKVQSPKQAKTKSGLFNFGKKTSKGTSVSGIPAVVTGRYTKQRENEMSVEEGEVVLMMSSNGEFALVERSGDERGYLPISLLAFTQLDGENMGQQIESRRKFFARLDNVAATKALNPLTPSDNIISPSRIYDSLPTTITDRPIIINSLDDIQVKEFSCINLSIQIFCTSPFTVVWRGPAVTREKVELTATNSVSNLKIERVLQSYSGFYSVVATSHCGSAISHCLLTVISKPFPPSNLNFKMISPLAIQLKWSAVPSTLYMIEYKREGMTKFRSVHCGISATKISIRGFKLAVYQFQVVAYNKFWRSDPSNAVSVDFETLAFKVRNTVSDGSLHESLALTHSTQF